MSEFKIALLDYGMGNLRSVCRALEHSGGQVDVVSEPFDEAMYQAIVFPGQGAMVQCMRHLKSKGLDHFLRNWIEKDKPYLGICLGLHVLFEFSEEGNTEGLGLFKGQVKRFDLEAGFKIPHMGWNPVQFKRDSAVFHENKSVDSFYFVHSYHANPEDPELALCTTNYGHEFVSGIQNGNCYGLQFHPEKSQAKGLQIYSNFIKYYK